MPPSPSIVEIGSDIERTARACGSTPMTRVHQVLGVLAPRPFDLCTEGKGNELKLFYDTPSWIPNQVPCTDILGGSLTTFTPGAEMYYNWTLPDDLGVKDSDYVISYFNQTTDAAGQNFFSSSAFVIQGYESRSSATSPQSTATPMPTTGTTPSSRLSTSRSTSLSTGAKIGIGIGASSAFLLSFLGAWVLLRHRRRRPDLWGTGVEGKTGFEKPELDAADTQHRFELCAEAYGRSSPYTARATEPHSDKEPTELPA
ncbi:uncharacterized protein CCOS01_16928 [Colletotrichum costaricense]|uniref:Uncharacterized protein n=1 Tax=Colletotrichum costaricense TaxID=1209916 RepID=A0AAJ0DRY6_9PEZI|nr:uncharacterized protein CCOS01_16928 [Colletotrichum costaricense]KAK1503853.1 hypothetical protein CCOS01_16928 [Colletotrichum costaricense]